MNENGSGPGDATLKGEITLLASPGRSLPPFTVRGARGWLSGYVVPVLSGTIGGSLRTPGETISLEGGSGYHDHNWGTWGGVIWDWGVAHAGDYDVLYGGVHGAAADEARRRGARFLVYVVDSLGVTAVMEPRQLLYSGAQAVAYRGNAVQVPQHHLRVDQVLRAAQADHADPGRTRGRVLPALVAPGAQG